MQTGFGVGTCRHNHQDHIRSGVEAFPFISSTCRFYKECYEGCLAENEKQQEVYVPAESSGTQPPAFDVGFAHEGRRTAATSKRQGGHQVQRIWSFKNQKRSPTTFFHNPIQQNHAPDVWLLLIQ